jgi:hypothetical protein
MEFKDGTHGPASHELLRNLVGKLSGEPFDTIVSLSD